MNEETSDVGNVKTFIPATIQPVPAVVELLERMLEMAKSGELRDIVLAATMTENRYHTAVETGDLITSMGLLSAALHAAAATGRDNSVEV